MSQIKTGEFHVLLKECLYSTNRTIYNWSQAGKFQRQKLSHTDIRGLVMNWFHRCLRNYITQHRINSIFRKGSLSISIDPENGYINDLRLMNYGSSSYQPEYDLIQEVNKAFLDFEYESAYYDPSTDVEAKSLVPGSFVPMKTLEEVNFSSLEAIKF